jgi:ribonucleoside-diphosphate reductase alpha chain/ribonucleoside-triphosphate reductase
MMIVGWYNSLLFTIQGEFFMLLSDSFLEKYKSLPFPGTQLGEFVMLRTYSRWIDAELRREKWWEIVNRVVEYSISLYSGPNTINLQKEAEQLYDLIFNLKVFPAGRTLWVGGTEAAKKFPTANFNCSFRVIDSIEAFGDLFYLLLVGTGVGFRILPSDVDKIPTFNKNILLTNYPYNPVPKNERRDRTIVTGNGAKYISIGDSKDGWVEALKEFLILMQYPDVKHIYINYDIIRPKGELLKTFGGRASGPTGLANMFAGIHQIITETGKLSPVNCLDICNLIGEAVVVGGVRRTSEIGLFEYSDTDVLNAKTDLWTENTPNYGKYHRSMSNNTIFFNNRPNISILHDIFDAIKNNGEPGLLNAKAASYRRPNFNGINPCAEILLDNRGLCNLSTVNLMAFVEDGQLNVAQVYNAIQMATRVGLRQTNVELELPDWDYIQKRDRLIGVSLTGYMDMLYAINKENDLVYQDHLLSALNTMANTEAVNYAREMRIPTPLLVTTVKPEGTISQLPTVSSGIHRSYAPYYIRRVRISGHDPLAKVMRDLNYPIYPENGQSNYTAAEFAQLPYDKQNEVLANCDTWVIEFPVKTAAKEKSVDETAISQFNRYLQFQKQYTDHNTSITITVGDDEWDELIASIYNNWDNYIAISFLPKADGLYPLMPYEAITEDEFNYRNNQIVDADIAEQLEYIERQYYSTSDGELDPSCETGVCSPR